MAQVPGVRCLTPHCCRHTYVSQLQAMGVPLETIQSLAGHAQVDMTEHYLHVQDTAKNAAAERIGALTQPA
ncbi:MAG: tyrosine-type recombinase/integrase [Oscillospiraceae bacterium]|nr:tyrosine-type recombinase/integrase [Oscillospiraceae bacterium]